VKLKSTEDRRCDVGWGLSRSQTGAPDWAGRVSGIQGWVGYCNVLVGGDGGRLRTDMLVRYLEMSEARVDGPGDRVRSGFRRWRRGGACGERGRQPGRGRGGRAREGVL